MNNDKDDTEETCWKGYKEEGSSEEDRKKTEKSEEEIDAGKGSGEDEGREEVHKVNIREKVINAKDVVVQAAYGNFLRYSPGAVADLIVVGWRCWFLTLKTLETALAVAPRSSPYGLGLLSSLRHLSFPGSRLEVRKRLIENYAAFSGEYFWVLRNLVYLSVCRFVIPWRVVLAMVFLALCGFVPLEDRRVGPYLMPQDFQRLFLVIVAVCVSGMADVAACCILFAFPIILLHLFFHDSAVSSHRPIFSNLIWR